MKQRSRRSTSDSGPGALAERMRRWEGRLLEQLKSDGMMRIPRGDMPALLASVRVAERWRERTDPRWVCPDAK